MTTTGSARTRRNRSDDVRVWMVRGAVAAAVVLLVAAAARDVLAGSTGELRDGVAAVAFTVIGGRVAYRRPANPVGWLFLAVGLAAAAAAFLGTYSESGALVSWLGSWLWWPPYGLLPLALLLFPDGRLPSRGWRWAAVAAVLGAVVPTVGLAVGALFSSTEFLSGGAVDPSARPYVLVSAAGMLCAAAAAAAGATALALRWRRAVDRDRRQVTWPLVAAVAVTFGWVLESLGVPGVWVLGGAAVPVAAAVAIARYGLYDLGTIVSRTLTYTILTLLLGGLYAVIVLTLTGVLSSVAGGFLPEAAGAMAVAALFQPARLWVQQAIDRRFNRMRYDAIQVAESFSVRLREHVELDTLAVDLLDVVDQTVQPAHRSLWLPSATSTPTGPRSLHSPISE